VGTPRPYRDQAGKLDRPAEDGDGSPDHCSATLEVLSCGTVKSNL
jgi:hypothetical protein